jgi:hypothetical protein
MAQSFTTTYKGIVLAPVTDIQISEAFDPRAGGTHPPAFPFKAIWDTGATHSVVTDAVVKKLGLAPVSKRKSHTGGGVVDADVYLMNMMLPNRVEIVGVPAACLPIDGPDALIGMDIMTRGDFAITNHNGVTKLSFQMPSTHDIDFVANPSSFTQRSTKVGRNAPCPCGSGKKYKNCHGA